MFATIYLELDRLVDRGVLVSRIGKLREPHIGQQQRCKFYALHNRKAKHEEP